MNLYLNTDARNRMQRLEVWSEGALNSSVISPYPKRIQPSL